GVAAGEELVAGGAEPLPDRLLLAAADRTDRLPLRLELLDLVGGLDPVGRSRQHLGALAERDLARQVAGARFGLRREVRFAARPRRVVRRLEAAPQRLALRARHVGRLAPLRLQLAHVPGDLLGILDRLERFHLLAELLLDADVRPPLPVGDVAQLLHLRHQRGLRRLQPLDDLVVILLRRQLRDGAERGADVLQRPLASLEREVGARGNRFEPAGQLLQARQRFAPRLLILFVRRRLALAEHAFSLGVAQRDLRIGRARRRQAVPLAADDAELPPRRRQILERRRGGRFVGELGQPRQTPCRVFVRRFRGRLGAGALGGRLFLARAIGRRLLLAVAFGRLRTRVVVCCRSF